MEQSEAPGLLDNPNPLGDIVASSSQQQQQQQQQQQPQQQMGSSVVMMADAESNNNWAPLPAELFGTPGFPPAPPPNFHAQQQQWFPPSSVQQPFLTHPLPPHMQQQQQYMPPTMIPLGPMTMTQPGMPAFQHLPPPQTMPPQAAPSHFVPSTAAPEAVEAAPNQPQEDESQPATSFVEEKKESTEEQQSDKNADGSLLPPGFKIPPLSGFGGAGAGAGVSSSSSAHGILPTPVRAPPPLPPGFVPKDENPWIQFTDEDDGETWYYNRSTGKSQWKRPKEMRLFVDSDDEASGESIALGRNSGWYQVRRPGEPAYYYSEDTGESVWEIPDEVREEAETLERIIKHLQKEDWSRLMSDPDATGAKRERRTELDEQATKRIRVAVLEEEERIRGPAHSAKVEQDSDDEDSLDQAISTFKQMLRDCNVDPSNSWEQEMPKFLSDPRFSCLSKLSHKRHVFADYVRHRAAELREEDREKRTKKLASFRALLRDENVHKIDALTSFKDYKRIVNDRAEYQALSESEAEALFREYSEPLREARRKRKEAAKENFKALLSETESIEADSRWSRVKDVLKNDERYKALHSDEREKLFREYTRELRSSSAGGSSSSKSRDALKERQREAERKRMQEERELRRHRELHQKQARLDELRALFEETVKDVNVSFDATYKRLKGDRRLNGATGRSRDDIVSEDEKRKIFDDRIAEIMQSARKQFETMLDQHSNALDRVEHWKDAYEIIKDDARMNVIEDERQRSILFEEFKRRRTELRILALMKFFAEISQTLVRTPLPPHENDDEKEHWEGTLQVLAGDRRWLDMADAPEERQRMLLDYIADLKRKAKDFEEKTSIRRPTRENVKEIEVKPTVRGRTTEVNPTDL